MLSRSPNGSSICLTVSDTPHSAPHGFLAHQPHVAARPLGVEQADERRERAAPTDRARDASAIPPGSLHAVASDGPHAGPVGLPREGVLWLAGGHRPDDDWLPTSNGTLASSATRVTDAIHSGQRSTSVITVQTSSRGASMAMIRSISRRSFSHRFVVGVAPRRLSAWASSHAPAVANRLAFARPDWVPAGGLGLLQLASSCQIAGTTAACMT
jgi:hypothetical protein